MQIQSHILLLLRNSMSQGTAHRIRAAIQSKYNISYTTKQISGALSRLKRLDKVKNDGQIWTFNK